MQSWPRSSVCRPSEAGKRFSLGLVQCGCMSHARHCGLLDTLTSAGKKNVYNLDI